MSFIFFRIVCVCELCVVCGLCHLLRSHAETHIAQDTCTSRVLFPAGSVAERWAKEKPCHTTYASFGHKHNEVTEDRDDTQTGVAKLHFERFTAIYIHILISTTHATSPGNDKRAKRNIEKTKEVDKPMRISTTMFEASHSMCAVCPNNHSK